MITRIPVRTACVTLAVCLGAPAFAVSYPGAPVASVEDEREIVSGVVRSVDTKADRFTVAVGENDRTITIDAKTEYLLDGKKSTKALALKVGVKARVTIENGVASKIEVTTVREPRR